MSSTELLNLLAANRITLFRDGGKLRFRGPKGACTSELRDLVAQHRDEIFCLLAGSIVQPKPEELPPVACRCGSAAFDDVPIHGGCSTRRDCAQCGRFIDYVKWYGVTTK